VNGILSASSFSCCPDRQERRPGRSRRVFRKTLCSAKRANRPTNTPVPAKSRTTPLGPFGEVIRQTGPMAKANPIRFSTKYQDDESDLLYYGYRYYKPSTGTWASRDPKSEIGFRVSFQLDRKILSPTARDYLFILNSPINFVDYKGLWHICCRPVHGFLIDIFRHCEIDPDNVLCPKDSDGDYPITRDSSCCKTKSDKDMSDCLAKHYPTYWGDTSLPGDNCQAYTRYALIDCCGKSTWVPSWYAYPPNIPMPLP
jgi:RHS repeat-associated protein